MNSMIFMKNGVDAGWQDYLMCLEWLSILSNQGNISELLVISWKSFHPIKNFSKNVTLSNKIPKKDKI